MDQALIIKLIEQTILEKYGKGSQHTISIKPAWKYAFYNPAKKNSEGAIVIKKSLFSLLIFAIPILFLLIAFVVDGHYEFSYIPVLAIAIVIAIKHFYYNKVMIINSTGVTFDSHTYHWKDYNYAFISTILLHKDLKVNLILVDSAYRLTSLDVVGMGANSIGTAIRDFQPANWKLP